jgi:uncharacterized protein (DUF427 family)
VKATDIPKRAAHAAGAHRISTSSSTRRVRVEHEGRVLAESSRAVELEETGLPTRYYLPREDVRLDLLEASDTTSHCPFKGDATYWTIRAGDRTAEDAVWAYEAPLEEAAWLAGHASLDWSKADAWFCEDERVFGHLRDPYHRVDVFEASRPVRVRLGDAVIAESARAKLLFETGLPPMVYVPGADIAPGVLSPNDKRTVCPYKGEASYWDVAGADGQRVAGGAWSYETPLVEALEVARHVSFAGDGITVELDEPRDRFALAGQASASSDGSSARIR